MTDLEVAESLSVQQRAALWRASTSAPALNQRAARRLVARRLITHRSGHLYDLTPLGVRVLAHVRRLEASG